MYTTYCLIVHLYVYLLIIIHLVQYTYCIIDVLCFAVLNRPRPGFQTSLRLSRNARWMVKLIEETWGSLFSYRLFWRPLKPFWVEIMLRRWGPLPIFRLKVHPLRLNTMCRWSLQVASARRELKAMSWQWPRGRDWHRFMSQVRSLNPQAFPRQLDGRHGGRWR